MTAQFEVLSPWADADPVPLKGISARVPDLAGKKIGLFHHTKIAGPPMLAVVEKKLKARFPTAEFSYFRFSRTGDIEDRFDRIGVPEDAIKEAQERDAFELWVKEVDAVVGAVGDWGSCTKYLAYNMVSIEKRNKPTAALVNKGFVHDAMSAASSKGMPGIRIIAESIPSECVVEEQLNVGIEAELDNIIAALTKPLTAEEKTPKAKDGENQSRIAFTGTLKELNRFFYQRGWADGFPVVPPTEEEIAEMLTGTDLPPSTLIAKLPPRQGKATIEKIAINAVMAGALPTYMPVLIAGVKALLEYGYFRGQAVSAGSWAPCYLFNGPICEDIHINTGVGVMSPGNIANAAIGRALGLIVKNIGGIRKGVEDMGNMGNPGKYTLVLGENEEQSPWEPLHVQHGFKKEDSVVTIFMPNNHAQSVVYGTNDELILRTIAYNISPSKRGTMCILIGPVHAKVLGDHGWTKEDVINFIAQYARAPLSHTPYYWKAWLSIPRESVPGMAGQKGMLLNPKDSPNESVPIMQPELVRLFVTGGTGGDVNWLSGVGRFTSKKIELPANWDKLVKKYRNIVPNYALY